MDNGHPTIVRAYTVCPDCGRTGPDVDGRCQDCYDAKRLRDAVAEWARVGLRPDITVMIRGETQQGADEAMAAYVALNDLARELGLVDGGAA